MTWMVKNSRGRRDALLTFALWGVLVVLAKILLNGVVLNIGARSINLGTIDTALVLGALATLIPYTVKRVKGAKDEPGSPPPAGFVSLELLGVFLVGLAELALVGVTLWASWRWGLVLLAALGGVDAVAVTVLFAADPEGRGGRVVAWSELAAVVLLGGAGIAAPVLLALRWPWLWWIYGVAAAAGIGWEAWVGRAWLAARARALVARVRGSPPAGGAP